MKDVNKDQFNFMDTQQAATAAFSVIDAVQKLDRQYQVASVAVCFLLVCERFDVDPRWAMEHVTKVMKSNEDTRYWSREFTAIAEYMEKEL